MPGRGQAGAPERAITYCIVPRELARTVHDPLRRYFRDDDSVVVVVERRNGAPRRLAPERRSAEAMSADERRRIRAEEGRRVADRRAVEIDVPAPRLPRGLARHADALRFVERIEPSTQELEDRDTARLVMRFQSGEREVFSAIYLRYFDRVYGYLRLLLRQQQEAEDVTQQVFLHAMQALDRYERRSQPFRAWLFRIVRNLALQTLDKTKRLELLDPEGIDAAAEPVADEVDLEALAWISDRELLLFVERLPLAQRQVLLLRFMMDLSTEQIAEVLGRNPESVRMLQSRALRFLRERLTALGRKPDRSGRRERAQLFRRQANVVRARRYALLRPGPIR